MTTSKTTLALQLLRDAEEKLVTARHLLEDTSGESTHLTARAATAGRATNVIEGIFDGQSMIGEDKKVYPIPANYASKSKLVEGDTLKLTILEDGSFIYKQIGPVERKHVRGMLHKDERGEFRVQVGRGEYRVLLASVTYFKGVSGDEVTLIIPDSGQASWGAIENIIKTTTEQEMPELVRESMAKLRGSETEQPDVSAYNPEEARAIPVSDVEPHGQA
jgi:hypothetical protein